MINRRLPHDVVRCEIRELELLRFIFALAFYNKHIAVMRIRISRSLSQEFVGNGQERMSVLLNALLDPQKTSPDNARRWHEPFSRNDDIEMAEEGTSVAEMHQNGFPCGQLVNNRD